MRGRSRCRSRGRWCFSRKWRWQIRSIRPQKWLSAGQGGPGRLRVRTRRKRRCAARECCGTNEVAQALGSGSHRSGFEQHLFGLRKPDDHLLGPRRLVLGRGDGLAKLDHGRQHCDKGLAKLLDALVRGCAVLQGVRKLDATPVPFASFPPEDRPIAARVFPRARGRPHRTGVPRRRPWRTP